MSKMWHKKNRPKKKNRVKKITIMPNHDAAAINICRRGMDVLRRYTLPHLSATPAIGLKNSVTNLPIGAYSCISINHHGAKSPSTVLTHCLSTRQFSSPLSSSAPSHLKSSVGTSKNNSLEKPMPFSDEADTDARPSLTKPPPQPPSSGNKSFLAKIWDKYSLKEQHKRSILGEKLFRSAQYRANDLTWYREARIPYEFRTRHAILTMHIWFLHKRLLADRVDPHAALLVQEELFDILWNDSQSRIRAEGVNELTVNKHLKDVQQLTFKHCTHYDHAFHEYGDNPKRRFEELALAVWMHVLNRDEEAYDDQLRRLAAYVEYQYANIVMGVPDSYFWEGRIPWGNIPDFSGMKDNDGNVLGEVDYSLLSSEELPKPWMKMLTFAGEAYYWNTETDETTWKRPL